MKQEGSQLHLRGLYIKGFREHVESTGEARTGWRELLQRLGQIRRGSGGGFGVKRVESDCVLAVCVRGNLGVKFQRLLLCPDERVQS